MQDLEKCELHILRERMAANAPPNLEAPSLDGTERSRKWHELREIFRSPSPTRNSGWHLLITACDKGKNRSHDEEGTTLPSPSRPGTRQA